MKREPDDLDLAVAALLVVVAFIATVLLIEHHSDPEPAPAPEPTVWTQVPPRPLPVATRASRSRAAAVSPLDWTSLARCESGGDPKAVSPTGKFRGAFQFSLRSWRWVGMTGDPVDYPLDVQRQAAVRLYTRQGAGAWPYCGRYLR